MPAGLNIHARISDPTKGVMIIGRIETKIAGPFSSFGMVFTASAMKKPKAIAKGVTKKQ